MVSEECQMKPRGDIESNLATVLEAVQAFLHSLESKLNRLRLLCNAVISKFFLILLLNN